MEEPFEVYKPSIFERWTDRLSPRQFRAFLVAASVLSAFILYKDMQLGWAQANNTGDPSFAVTAKTEKPAADTAPIRANTTNKNLQKTTQVAFNH